MFIDIPITQKSRSASPLSPVAQQRGKHSSLFDLLSRRFGRRSHDELFFHHNEEDTCSSSTESYSSASGQMAQGEHGEKSADNCSYEFNQTSGSNCSSDSGRESTNNANNTPLKLQRQGRPSSKLRRAMQNLTISTRSLSCSSTPNKDQIKPKVKISKKDSPSPAKKRILRQPVSYVYLKGVSGLPTQRVPRSSVCCYHTHA